MISFADKSSTRPWSMVSQATPVVSQPHASVGNDNGPSDHRTIGPPDHRIIGSSDRRTIGPSDHRTVGPSDLRTFGPSDLRTFGPSDHRTIGPSDLRTVGPSDHRTIGPSDHRVTYAELYYGLLNGTLINDTLFYPSKTNWQSNCIARICTT